MDKFKDECGVFGIFGHPEAANMTYLGLYALQHRGQESAGIAASDREEVRVSIGMGHVADVFNTAMAMVSLSQEAELFWHGAAGLDPASATATRVTPRDTSPCGYVVALDEPLVIEDVDRDTRFAGNAMLRAANMQFYAGVPLRTAMGHVLGALCVMDRTARAFTASELRLLGVMADDVMRMLALEAAARSAQVEAHSAEVDAPSAEAAPIVPT